MSGAVSEVPFTVQAASWPKSGSTWVRLLLANLMSESDEPVEDLPADTHGRLAELERFPGLDRGRAP